MDKKLKTFKVLVSELNSYLVQIDAEDANDAMTRIENGQAVTEVSGTKTVLESYPVEVVEEGENI